MTSLKRAFILFALALAGCAPAVQGQDGDLKSTTTTNTKASFVLVGTHPQAAQQPTAQGKTLETLFAWNGKLYAGYGDYANNTGPIAVTPFDPSTNSFTKLWVSDTEAIFTYLPFGQELVAPAIDPRISADYAAGPTWADTSGLGFDHVFAMASYTGTDLWAVGEKQAQCTAMRSLDGGQTWTTALVINHHADKSDCRFFFAAVYQGKLWLQAWDGTYPHGSSQVFDGTSWSSGPDLIPGQYDIGWHPTEFAGKLVYNNTHEGVAYGNPTLLAFDGTSVTTPQSDCVDFTVGGGALYCLSSQGFVSRTTDLASWTRVGNAPNGSRSVGFLNGMLYVGTAKSELYRWTHSF